MSFRTQAIHAHLTFIIRSEAFIVMFARIYFASSLSTMCKSDYTLVLPRALARS